MEIPMNLMPLVVAITVYLLYMKEMKNVTIDVKMGIYIAITALICYKIADISFIPESLIKSITLFPIILLTHAFGRGIGMSAGLVFGICQLNKMTSVIHPMQMLLDYILCYMVLGYATMWGNANGWKVFFGAMFATGLHFLIRVVSQIVFYTGEVPVSMDIMEYSVRGLIPTIGMDGFIVSVMIGIFPVKAAIKMLRGKKGGGSAKAS